MTNEEPLFLAKFPCFVPVLPPFEFLPNSASIKISGHNNYPVLHERNEIFIFAFTEKEFAQEYMYHKKMCGAALLMTVPTPDALVQMLKMIKAVRGGPANLLFDPSPHFRGWPISYDEAVSDP